MFKLCIYHANCNDGFCAAWLFHRAYPDAEFHAATYGDTPPDVRDRDVYILDFSYKRDVLLALIRDAESLTLLDHHVTAKADLADIEGATIVFDMTKSGARLAAEFLQLPSAPMLVDYTEDRDLWRWQLPSSREINAALSSYPRNFAIWDLLDASSIDELAVEGAAILRYQQQLVDAACRHAELVRIGDHDVPVCHSTVLQSEIGERLCQGRPYALIWWCAGDKYVCSLRSSPHGLDVSEIAKHYGGGGHKNAAGFSTTSLPWSPR